jgi:hypothetical protein
MTHLPSNFCEYKPRLTILKPEKKIFSLRKKKCPEKTVGRGVVKVAEVFRILQQVLFRDPSVIKLAFYKSITYSYCEQILDFLISCSLDADIYLSTLVVKSLTCRKFF